MNKIFPSLLLALGFAAASFADTPAAAPIKIGELLTVEGAGNLYKLSSDVYRSRQPDDDGFENLERMGIKSSLNLREYHNDRDEAEDTSIILLHYPVAAGKITSEKLLDIMTMLALAPKPVLVHCKHGADRTGAVCAAYRIVEQGWSAEDAVREMAEGPYGFHKRYYSYLPPYLKSIDWEQFRKDLRERIARRKAEAVGKAG